ncbi:sirohydrochlorin chelatase, partial [Actinomadura napierensis]|uniref:sirohydrochlorin chelatase n=1 Tax=Actinomadura napierensis TaxID=267854 RepID=UPI0031D2A25D
MADGRPALLAVAHGTRDPAGPAVVRELLDRVRERRPWLHVAEAYGELVWPSLEEAAAALGAGGPVVVVPLLLGRGYHALIDIPERAGRLLPGAVTARPLGPEALLADAVAGRLGAVPPGRHGNGGPPCPQDTVVLGAAASADPAGAADVRA